MNKTAAPGGNNSLWQNRLIAALTLLICLSLLWLNHRFSFRVDLSGNARHSLTQTTIDTLLLLDQPLAITAVIGPSKQARTAIEELINRCRAHKSDISLLFVNPETEPDKARELVAASGGELILQYESREKRLQNLSERSFTQALHQLTRTSTRTVAFVSGHQERSPNGQTNDSYLYLTQGLMQSGLNSLPLSLVTAPRVPDNIDILVIAAPQRPYFPGEVASVLDYLNRGGNLLWLLEGESLAGLDALAVELGIGLSPGVVIDVSSQAYGTDTPSFTILDQFPKHPVNAGLASAVLLPGAQALDITPLAGQTTLPLLQTGQDSWTEIGALEGAIKFDENTQELQGPLTLAASIERQKQQRIQRVAVLGDADLFASTWIGNGANEDYAARLFNWLASDDQLIEFDTLKPADAEVKLSTRQTLFIGAGFLIALPLLLLSIAAIQWYRGRHA